MKLRSAGVRALAPRHVGALVAAALTISYAGLAITAPAQADTSNASGVSIDVGGAGGDAGFIADTYGTGGSADTLPAGDLTYPNWGPTVAHPIPADIWDTSRVGESHYSIPDLTPGATYQARLYFLDWYFKGAGEREFNVAINGTQVLTNFDINATAINKGADGPESFGVEEDFTATADATGTITLDFTRGAVDQPQVNAIVLVPDNFNGVSIDLGGAGGDDGFIADTYGTGGSADTLPASDLTYPNFGPTVANPIPADIWDTSRVGESHYSIPGLTPGSSYQTRLYFLDWYFKGAGEREFNVAINGTQVLTNFDINATAINKGADGPESFGVEEDFTATADATGTITLDFTRGAVDQPQVNAIVLVPAG